VFKLHYAYARRIYVQVYRDRIVARDVNLSVSVEGRPESPYSTDRNLVGSFTSARALLRSLFQKLGIFGWFKIRPIVLMHPMELSGGGLSEVEERVLLELADAAGAAGGRIYLGAALSDDGVRSQLKDLE
jgi:hypothetical protein